MNEFNAVLAYKVVPNDTRAHVIKMINNIYKDITISVQPKAFFTDNVATDSKQLSKCFKNLFSNDNVLILQVI